MTIRDRLTVEVVLAAFDEYLDRTRGLCPEVRHNYARSVRAFMEPLFGDGEVDLGGVCTRDVVDFVVASTRRYRPATVQLVATSLGELPNGVVDAAQVSASDGASRTATSRRCR